MLRGSSFTVNITKVGCDSLLLGGSAFCYSIDRICTHIYSDGELGRTNYDSHNVSEGVRLTF